MQKDMEEISTHFSNEMCEMLLAATHAPTSLQIREVFLITCLLDHLIPMQLMRATLQVASHAPKSQLREAS